MIWRLAEMQDADVETATTVMGKFIGSNDTKEYTKWELMKDHGFDEEQATELAEIAWKEWVEAYTG